MPPMADSCLTGLALMMFLCTNCPRTAYKSHRPMTWLLPQPCRLVILNRSIRNSAMSINPVPTRPPTKANTNNLIGPSSFQSWFTASTTLFSDDVFPALFPVSPSFSSFHSCPCRIRSSSGCKRALFLASLP